VIYSSWYGMDMNKQAKAKTTFDNIIIYVHEPTEPHFFGELSKFFSSSECSLWSY
jgi:hypothetical protein